MSFKTILVFAVLSACCPSGGIDKSRQVETLFLAVEGKYEQVQSFRAEITLTGDQTFRSNGYEREGQDVLEFRFPQEVNESDIVAFQVENRQDLNEVKTFSYKWSDLEKQPYQIAEEQLAEQGRVGGFVGALCGLENALDQMLTPRAYATSCPAKEGSKLTYRTGVLIKGLDLNGP